MALFVLILLFVCKTACISLFNLKHPVDVTNFLSKRQRSFDIPKHSQGKNFYEPKYKRHQFHRCKDHFFKPKDVQIQIKACRNISLKCFPFMEV